MYVVTISRDILKCTYKENKPFTLCQTNLHGNTDLSQVVIFLHLVYLTVIAKN